MNGLLYKSQAKKQTPNLVDNSSAIQANSQAFNNVSNATRTASNILQQKVNKEMQIAHSTFEMETQTALTNTMSDLYKEFQDDPASLNFEMIKAKNKLSSGIRDDNIKLNMEKTYLTLKKGYLDRADENHSIKLDNDNKNAMITDVNSIKTPLGLFYDKMFNNKIDDEDRFLYKTNQDKLVGHFNKVDRNGKRLLNTAEIDKMNSEFRNIKLNSAYNHFNDLYTNDNERFNAEYGEWSKNPSGARESYGLSQEDYEKILKNL